MKLESVKVKAIFTQNNGKGKVGERGKGLFVYFCILLYEWSGKCAGIYCGGWCLFGFCVVDNAVVVHVSFLFFAFDDFFFLKSQNVFHPHQQPLFDSWFGEKSC